MQPLNCPLRHCRRARGWYRAAVLVGAPRKNRSGPRGAGGARALRPRPRAKFPWQCPERERGGGGAGRRRGGSSKVLRVSYRQTGLAPSVRIKFLKLIMGLCGGLRGPGTTGRERPPRAQPHTRPPWERTHSSGRAQAPAPKTHSYSIAHTQSARVGRQQSCAGSAARALCVCKSGCWK